MRTEGRNDVGRVRQLGAGAGLSGFSTLFRREIDMITSRMRRVYAGEPPGLIYVQREHLAATRALPREDTATK